MSTRASAGAREERAERTSILWTFLGTLASAVITAPLDDNSQHLIAVAIGAFISAVVTEGRRGIVFVVGVAALAWFVTCGSSTGLARLAPDYQTYLPTFADPPPSDGGTAIPSPTPAVPSETPDAGTRPDAPAVVKCTDTCVINLVGTGTSPVLIDEYSFPTAHPGFTIAPADDGCSGKTLGPGEHCTITVSFTADPAGGIRRTTLLIHEKALHRALPNRVTLVGGESEAEPTTPPPSTTAPSTTAPSTTAPSTTSPSTTASSTPGSIRTPGAFR
ncbi:hypothetical protein [Frankia sp. AgKG'84/4]|uniref:hypothetical protein n=1 Tax=Frankia sp. AgKG'84/4 TaxID=573490 RepID=UPI00200F952D|nr:hypothetical protein [Frankia sp. AgKG'84/4]MCL9795214.1 hypothetical protein [Frankia sp. AgKG'84/4]